jgi:peroxiredoxin
MKQKLILVLLQLFAASQVRCQIPAQTIPDFKFYKTDAAAFTQKDLPPGKLIFIVFFDPTCDHCQRAIHNLDAQYKSFEKTAIFLVSLDDRDKMNRFLATYAPGLQTKKNITLLQDKLNQFVTTFTPYRYPAMYLYGTDKKLIDYEDNEESMFRLIHSISKNEH